MVYYRSYRDLHYITLIEQFFENNYIKYYYNTYFKKMEYIYAKKKCPADQIPIDRVYKFTLLNHAEQILGNAARITIKFFPSRFYVIQSAQFIGCVIKP